MLLFALLLAAQDVPRVSAAEHFSAKSVDELQTCFARVWVSKGIVTPLAVTGGVDIFWQQRGAGLGGPGKELLIFEIRDLGDKRRVTASYRRPWSAKIAVKMTAQTMEKCEAVPSGD